MPAWLIIAFVLLSAACIFSAAKLFSKGKKDFAKSCFLGYFSFAAIFFAIWIFGVSVPEYILFLVMLTVFGTSFLGHYLGYYTKSRVFDRWLHAFGTFSAALLAYTVLDDFIGTGGSLLFRAVFIFFAGNSLGALFEILEMLHDRKNKTEPKAQKGLRDTDMDMVFNVLGSVLAAAFAYFWILE